MVIRLSSGIVLDRLADVEPVLERDQVLKACQDLLFGNAEVNQAGNFIHADDLDHLDEFRGAGHGAHGRGGLKIAFKGDVEQFFHLLGGKWLSGVVQAAANDPIPLGGQLLASV